MKLGYALSVLFCFIAFATELFACSLGRESNFIIEQQTKAYSLIAFSFLFLVFTIVLYCKRKRKGLFLAIISSLIIGLAFSTSNADVGDCGYGAVENAKMSLSIAFICFSLQFIFWFSNFIKKRNAELP